MIAQNSTALNSRTEIKIMQPAKQATHSSWRRAAFGGAAVCSLLALAYTLAFMVYAMARSALTVTTTVNTDAGMFGTLIATWASLFVAALIIGLLLAVAVAILGAFTGVVVKAALASPIHKPNLREQLSSERVFHSPSSFSCTSLCALS